MPRNVRALAASLLAQSLLTAACSTPAREALTDPAWQVQLRDTTVRFIGLYAVDRETVWAAGSGGHVARSTDGGATWALMTVPGADSLQFRDVHAFDGREAFVLSIGNGPDSRIFHTADGGATWTLSFRNNDPDAFFDCLSFWDRRRGVAFSDSHDGEFTLIRTLDGGATWERIDTARVPDARPGEGAFASSGTCVVTRPGGPGWFATGASGVDTRVIRTADYGDRWAAAPTPIPSPSSTGGIFSLAFLDDVTGVAVGGDFTAADTTYDDVALTHDGGATWVPGGRTGLGGAVYGVSWVPGAATLTLVAVSPAGSAYSADGGGSWTRFGDDEYWSVAFVAPDAGWAAGPGRISRIGQAPGRE